MPDREWRILWWHVGSGQPAPCDKQGRSRGMLPTRFPDEAFGFHRGGGEDEISLVLVGLPLLELLGGRRWPDVGGKRGGVPQPWRLRLSSMQWLVAAD